MKSKIMTLQSEDNNVKQSEPDKPILTISSIALAVYIFYTVFIWLIEAIDFLCYLASFSQATILSRIFVLILLIIGIWKVRKFIFIEKTKFSVLELLSCCFLVVFSLMKCIYPDTSYDTFNYQLIAQHPGFASYFVGSFAKGNFQVWGFRLGTRMFYLFRMILGFRMGTILNTCVLVLFYKQTSDFLKTYIMKDKIDKTSMKVLHYFFLPEIWALIIVTSQQILMQMGIYYVDILPMPIAIECLCLILNAQEKKPTSLEIYYFAALCGLWFAFKMTNIVYIVPFILIYIIICHKVLSIKPILICAVLCALPCSIYLIFAFRETGNPVFPYYNTIFHSPLFGNFNFKDMRWGPTTLIEALLWPIYRVIRPDYRQLEISNSNTFLYAIGIIGFFWTTCNIIYSSITKKKIEGQRVLLCSCVLFSGLLWSFSTGILRYFIFGDWLLGVLAYNVLMNLLSKLKVIALKSSLLIALLVLCLFISCTQSVLNTKQTLEGTEWAWRAFSVKSAKTQLSKIFRDRTFFEQEIDADYYLISYCANTGYADLMNHDTYVFNMDYLNYMADNDEKRRAEQFLNEMDGTIRDIRDIYWENIENYVEQMNQCGMYIDGVDCVEGQTGHLSVPNLVHNNKMNTLDVAHDIKVSTKEDNTTLRFMLIRKGITYDQMYTVKILNEKDEQVYQNTFYANNEQINYSVDIIGNSTYSIIIQGEDGADEGASFYLLNMHTE